MRLNRPHLVDEFLENEDIYLMDGSARLPDLKPWKIMGRSGNKN